MFSKDRSFQLHETLRSLHSNVVVPSSSSSPSAAAVALVNVEVRVLFKVSNPAFRESYSTIAAQFAGDDRYGFIEEDDFAAQIEELVAGRLRSDDAPRGYSIDGMRFVLFTVDDALFCRTFHLGEAAALLNADPSVFCYHLKLHPAVTYSHPADKVVDPPPFRERSNRTKADGGGGGGSSLTFERSLGTGDWNYPWDLAWCARGARVAALRKTIRTLCCSAVGGALLIGCRERTTTTAPPPSTRCRCHHRRRCHRHHRRRRRHRRRHSCRSTTGVAIDVDDVIVQPRQPPPPPAPPPTTATTTTTTTTTTIITQQ